MKPNKEHNDSINNIVNHIAIFFKCFASDENNIWIKNKIKKKKGKMWSFFILYLTKS